MSPPAPLIDFAPASILVVRLSAIGDVIMSSALLPALAEGFPGARLSWLTEEAPAGLLQGHPRLDRLIVWPRRRWRRLRREGRYRELLAEARALAAELRAQRFDLALDLQGLLKSGVWARLSGAPVRIGLGSKEGSQWLMTKTLDRRTETRRIGGEYLKLARALGLDPGRFEMDIRPRPEDARAALALLAEAGVEGPYAALAPFTTRPQKHWFEERWAELAIRLERELGLRPVLLGGPGDGAAAARIQAAAPGLANLAGRTGLLECAALLGKARLLVGVDTGLTHLGTAMGAPTLALFGSTRPYLDAGTDRTKVLYETLPCSPCKRRPVCGGRFDCMARHTPTNILDEARRLLETHP